MSSEKGVARALPSAVSERGVARGRTGVTKCQGYHWLSREVVFGAEPQRRGLQRARILGRGTGVVGPR